jgi:hypothetical protein
VTRRVRIVYATLGALLALAVAVSITLPTGLVSVGGTSRPERPSAPRSAALSAAPGVLAAIAQSLASQGVEVSGVRGCVEQPPGRVSCIILLTANGQTACAGVSYRLTRGRPEVLDFRPLEPRYCE